MSDAWDMLRSRTRARIGLGRAGDSLPTAPLLAFQMAHAKARDAVHGQVNWEQLVADLATLEHASVCSAATDRATYLRRPDLGRRLAPGAAETLPSGPFDLVFVVADGLSAAAVQSHAAPVMAATRAMLSDIEIGPVVLAQQARVAIGDPVGAAMQARIIVVLIGERPGLSAADSLGAYITFAPAPGRRDSERNCVSNIHAHGLAPQQAAARLAWLVRAALRLRLTGVALKEALPPSDNCRIGELGA